MPESLYASWKIGTSTNIELCVPFFCVSFVQHVIDVSIIFCMFVVEIGPNWLMSLV